MEKTRNSKWGVGVVSTVLAIAMLALVPACAVTEAYAAEPTIENASQYQAAEFNFDSFAVVRSTDLNEGRVGVGAGVSVFLSRNLGVSVSALTYDRRERLLDQADASLVYRVPSDRSAISFFGGAGYDFERDAETIHVGAGVEHRFSQHFGIFADAKFEKRLSDGENAGVGRVGIRATAF